MTDKEIERLIRDVTRLASQKRYHDAERLVDIIADGDDAAYRRVMCGAYHARDGFVVILPRAGNEGDREALRAAWQEEQERDRAL